MDRLFYQAVNAEYPDEFSPGLVAPLDPGPPDDQSELAAFWDAYENRGSPISVYNGRLGPGRQTEMERPPIRVLLARAASAGHGALPSAFSYNTTIGDTPYGLLDGATHFFWRDAISTLVPTHYTSGGARGSVTINHRIDPNTASQVKGVEFTAIPADPTSGDAGTRRRDRAERIFGWSFVLIPYLLPDHPPPWWTTIQNRIPTRRYARGTASPYG